MPGLRLEDENGIINVIDDGIPGGRAPANNFEDELGNYTLTQADVAPEILAPRLKVRLR